MARITPFDPWHNTYCTCPAKLSVNPYSGCSHGCLYCYASGYIKNFSCVRPKKNILKALTGSLRKNPGYILAMANSSDPYPPAEKKLLLTRGLLEAIAKTAESRLLLVTKSDLVLRDIAVLRKIKNIVVSISLATLDARLAARLEPYAPSPAARLGAIETLSRCLPVACRLDPLIPGLNTEGLPETIKAIRARGTAQIITSTYKAKPDNFKRMMSAFKEYSKTWERLYLKEGVNCRGYRYLPYVLRRELIRKVRDITLKERMDFSSCREGLSELNTAACDGSSLFAAPQPSENR